jgi:diguanylate cyclase (GGDEF)-like protein
MKSERGIVHDVRTMALAAAILFASGGSITLLALVLPHGRGPDPVADIITSLIAFVFAAGVYLWRARMRVWTFHLLLQIGNLLVAVGMFTGGPTETTRNYTLLYLWGALYASYFFSRRAAIAHMTAGALGYGLVLLLKEPTNDWISGWFVMMSSFLVAGLMVNWLTQTIHSLARTDPLTGLSNRRTFEVELDRELARAQREQRPLSIVLLDVDNLKGINDSEGHAAGDRLLKSAGAAWNDKLRSGDLLARYGGDEFAALLPDCSGEDAIVVAGRLRNATPNTSTSSIGIASWDGRESGEMFLSRADRALYEAKRGGKNRVVAAPLPLDPFWSSHSSKIAPADVKNGTER